jgi:hypothetical protein
MARTRSFFALRGFLTFFYLAVILFQKPRVVASVHTPSQRDVDDTLSIRARPHRLIKRSPSAQPFIPRDYITHGALAERLDDKHTNFARATDLTTATAWNGQSFYKKIGTSGIAAMQLAVVTDRYVILFDKAEHNPLKTSDGFNAWSALLDTHKHSVRALKVKTNSFCAGGSPIFHANL